MSRYFVDIKEKAQQDLVKLKKDEPKYYVKALKLIGELYEHPRTGTGKPKQLSADRAGQWRRKISDKHRLIYEIHDQVVEVLVLSAWGHYDDK
ncbi:MAG: Txe/YoeB family addiction module toxin [Prevotella sp.]|nr:Txe/YoeB family addiction module toxin [Prevotella sp.]